jgi:hypothetical protein
MLEAAEEAYGFSFVDVSLHRLRIQEKAEQHDYEAPG